MTYSPIVRLYRVDGYGETTTWAWFDEFGAQQGEASGVSGAVMEPLGPPYTSISDPLTVMVQAALNYATERGLPFEATGATYRASDGKPAFLQTWATIVIPAHSDSDIRFRNIVWLMRPLDGGDGLVMDTSQLDNFQLIGSEVLYRGSSCAVKFRATNLTVVDNNRTINSGSEFHLASVTTQCGGAFQPVGSGISLAVIGYDMTFGNIWANRFRYGQLSGNNVAKNGILVFNPPAGSLGFRNNQHEINYIMKCRENCVLIGANESQAPQMGSGSWNIGMLLPDFADAIGFNTFGHADLINVCEIKGPMWRGAVLEPSSAGNVHRIGPVSGFSDQAIIDAGVGNRGF